MRKPLNKGGTWCIQIERSSKEHYEHNQHSGLYISTSKALKFGINLTNESKNWVVAQLKATFQLHSNFLHSPTCLKSTRSFSLKAMSEQRKSADWLMKANSWNSNSLWKRSQNRERVLIWLMKARKRWVSTKNERGHENACHENLHLLQMVGKSSN